MDNRLVTGSDGNARCWWGASTPDYADYHDTEWGFPVDDDRLLFEKVCLEGFQSGLSWLTILRKRDNFRKAFRDFDFEAVARFNERSVQRLLGDAGIVRHQGKIRSTINNAKRAVDMQDEFGSLGAFFWRFEPSGAGRPILESTSPESIALSKELKRLGWSFVGPTTMYAFMQAMGIVNDHLPGCAAYERAERDRQSFRRPGS